MQRYFQQEGYAGRGKPPHPTLGMKVVLSAGVLTPKPPGGEPAAE